MIFTKKTLATTIIASLLIIAFTITSFAGHKQNNKPKSTGWIKAGVVMDVYTEEDVPAAFPIYQGKPIIAILPYYGSINVTIKDLTSGGTETFPIPPHGNPCVFYLDLEHRYQITCDGKWKVTSTDRISILSW